MIIATHQPNYIPWLGYFYKIAEADVFVFLDDVQYSHHGMHNYNYIKTPQGLFRLKIPVTGSQGDKINSIYTKDELNWKPKHLQTLESNYKRAKWFNEVFADFSGLLNSRFENLARQNESIIKFYCNKFEIKTKFVLSSSLNINTSRENRIIDICKALNGDVYLSGLGAKAYQNEENFVRNGIVLRYSNFIPFQYPQQWGNFLANVSIIDFLMNCGYDWQLVTQNSH